MTWLIGTIITLGALLGAVKGIFEFVDWAKKKKDDKEEDESLED